MKIKAIIIGGIFFSCSYMSKPEFKHLKENLYTNNKGQIFMKLSNKGVMHPALQDNWKDTIYRQFFYFEYDSIININDIIDVKKFKTIIPDNKYSDGKYIYTSNHYLPGKRMHTVALIPK